MEVYFKNHCSCLCRPNKSNVTERSNQNTHQLHEYRIMQAGLLRHLFKPISKVIQQNKAISAN